MVRHVLRLQEHQDGVGPHVQGRLQHVPHVHTPGGTTGRCEPLDTPVPCHRACRLLGAGSEPVDPPCRTDVTPPEAVDHSTCPQVDALWTRGPDGDRNVCLESVDKDPKPRETYDCSQHRPSLRSRSSWETDHPSSLLDPGGLKGRSP